MCVSKKRIIKGKLQYAAFLKKHVFKSLVDGAFMKDTIDGRLGTHSIARKFATIYPRQCGGIREDVDYYRVRWKSCR